MKTAVKQTKGGFDRLLNNARAFIEEGNLCQLFKIQAKMLFFQIKTSFFTYDKSVNLMRNSYLG